MSAMPLPMDMNAFIAYHIFQVMMSYSMIQPSLPARLPCIDFSAPHSPENQSNVVIQADQLTSEQIREHVSDDEIEEIEIVNELTIDHKPRHASEMDHTVLDEDERLVAREEGVLEELRAKAMRLKKTLLRRFKREKKSIIHTKHSCKGIEACTFPGCGFRTPRHYVLLRHIALHYPDVYFCPVCHSSFRRVDVFDKHFQTQSTRKGCVVPCIESEEAMRYEIARDKERFNVYYLGAMEDFPMSEEHFEALAGRRREE